MFVGGIGSARSMQVAVGEAVFLLHPPSTFCRCLDRNGEGVSAE